MTVRECAVFFRAGSEDLFGILAEPPSPKTPDLAVVILGEGVPAGMRGQNAVLARLARAVAHAGYASFRFDYHGVGESTGMAPHVRRDMPFLDDLDAALAWLRTQGHRRFLIVGSCFGAQTALLAVPDRPEIISGVALLSCLVAAEGVSSPSPSVVRALTAAGDRGVAVLFCYGRDDPLYDEFEAAGPLGLAAGLGASSVEVELLDGRLHSFVDVDLQEPAIATVVAWVKRIAATLPAPAPGPPLGTWTSV